MTKKNEIYKINRKTLGIAVIVIVIIAVLLGIYFKGGFSGDQPVKITPKEEGPPPIYEMVVIENPDCEDCMNLTQAIEILKGAPTINITSDKIISFEEEEAKDMIEKYEIERLPAFFLFGDDLDAEVPPFEKKKDALVFGEVPPVYYDIAEDRIVGRVSLITLVNSDCEECFDLSPLTAQLKQMGMQILDETTIEYDSTEGKALVDEYDIIKVPTVIFSEDAAAYDVLAKAWDKVGSIEEDGKLVMREVNPPYYDIVADKVKGFVDLTYIVDESCEKCLDIKVMKTLFEKQMGMKFDEEKTVDISSDEGKELIEKYSLAYAPALVLAGDAKDYPSVKQTWDQAGEIFGDEYVFTKVNVVPDAVYKDLSTGEIMGLPEEEPEAEADSEETAAAEPAEEEAAEEPTEEPAEEDTEDAEEESGTEIIIE